MVRFVDVVAIPRPDFLKGGHADREHAFRHPKRVGSRTGTVKEAFDILGAVVDALPLRTEASTLTSLMRNCGSGVSVVVAVLSRTKSNVQACLSERATPYGELAPWLPADRDLSTVEGPAALQREISRQAMAIEFVNDYYMMMIGALAAIPMVLLLSRDGVAGAGG